MHQTTRSRPDHTLSHYLVSHARATPDQAAFVVLEDGEDAETAISYAALVQCVRNVAAQLAPHGLQHQRALLLYQDTVAFVVSLLACQQAGIVPVPVPYAKGRKQLSRLANILDAAGAAAILCAAHSIDDLRQAGLAPAGQVRLIATDPHDPAAGHGSPGHPPAHDIAFIQYTSGSTGRPKGVVVTHRNLLHNQGLIQATFGCTQQSRIFSWLPFHHDMGLIGSLLHALYVGCTCVLMSPFHFMQKPGRWLRAIGRHGITHSGGPNFAYDLCVDKVPERQRADLDLSGWRVAYNGSEPLRAATLERFSRAFGPCGFRAGAFFPCYGLAEATLLVSGCHAPGPPRLLSVDKGSVNSGVIRLTGPGGPDARVLVSSGGIAPGMRVALLATGTGRECGELEEGEICIAGDSVTDGYWNGAGGDLFRELRGEKYLATGDLGFRYGGELYVHGRQKDLLIVRGRNLYPYDVEQWVAGAVPAVEPNGVAVFGGDDDGEEVCLVVAEVKRTSLPTLDAAAVLEAIEREVAGTFGVNPRDVLLIPPLSLPRTTSGKIQRARCRELYAQDGFRALAAKTGRAGSRPGPAPADLLPAVRSRRDYDSIQAYLLGTIAARLGGSRPAAGDADLAGLGLDSLRAMELINTINKDLDINLDASRAFGHATVSGLARSIEQVLWLKNEQTPGGEIII
jgi:acyl-CoA synthetase (AMP-forming)/AMP-acid ligase II/acyl carrier protein